MLDFPVTRWHVSAVSIMAGNKTRSETLGSISTDRKFNYWGIPRSFPYVLEWLHDRCETSVGWVPYVFTCVLCCWIYTSNGVFCAAGFGCYAVRFVLWICVICVLLVMFHVVFFIPSCNGECWNKPLFDWKTCVHVTPMPNIPVVRNWL
jgi:hypothetical protein